jgi:hypothetical protein
VGYLPRKKDVLERQFLSRSGRPCWRSKKQTRRIKYYMLVLNYATI